MVTKQLRKITQKEFDETLNNHFFYQKGDELKRMILKNCDFSGIQIIEANLSGAIFDGSDFSGALSYDHSDYGKRVFYYCNLDNASFRSCNLTGIDFTGTRSMNGAILIDAKFQPKALGGFDNQIIATEKELELFQKAKEQEMVIEDKVKVIEKQEDEIKSKDDKLEKTSEKQSKDMLDIFDELRKDFSFEERLWMLFSFFILLIVFTIASSAFSVVSVYISAYANVFLLVGISFVFAIITSGKHYDDEESNWGEKIVTLFATILTILPSIYFTHEAWITAFGGNHWFGIFGTFSQSNWELLVPLTVILFSLLWFSVHQYGRAKKLRIEQQNKQAMIHFMQAVIAQDGKGSYAERSFPQLAPFFANAIIHRPFSQENYDPELPIDELIKRMKDAKDFIK